MLRGVVAQDILPDACGLWSRRQFWEARRETIERCRAGFIGTNSFFLFMTDFMRQEREFGHPAMRDRSRMVREANGVPPRDE